MLRKTVQEFIEKGFRKTQEEANKFDLEQKKISEEIDAFKQDMKQWSANSRLLRKK